MDYISIETADFTNKHNMINSPRSLRACRELGIIPVELYQISIEEYKSQNPSSLSLDQKMLQFRYEGYEKFRKDSINLVKKRREIIINKENENEDNKNRTVRTMNNFVSMSLEKLREREKKAMENLKNQQKKNIKNIIEEQINKEILKKIEQKKEWRQQKREEL